MALTVNDLHIFLENNLPEYKRRDVLAICKFYLKFRGVSDKKPFKTTFNRIQDFKKFICADWQGVEVNHNKKAPKKIFVPEFGYCHCGGILTIRTNRQDGTKFLGCLNYPKCRRTQSL